MEYKAPTYEEYCKATTYAKIRYRFGVYIQLISAILLLFLIYYTVTNIEEMKANPVEYAEEKMGVECQIPFIINRGEQEYWSIRDITSIREG